MRWNGLRYWGTPLAVTNDCCDMTQDKGTHWVKTGGNCDRKHVPMIQTSTGGREQEEGRLLDCGQYRRCVDCWRGGDHISRKILVTCLPVRLLLPTPPPHHHSESIAPTDRHENNTKQVCLTLGWSSVVFALCLLIEKNSLPYKYPKVTLCYPKET